MSHFLLILSLASAGIVSVRGQTLTPEQQNRMLEVLRKKMAEQQRKSSPGTRPALRPPSETPPSGAMETMPLPERHAMSGRAPSEETETPARRRALEVLRKAMAERFGTAAMPAHEHRARTPLTASRLQPSPAPAPAKMEKPESPAYAATPAQAEAQKSTVPKTKQERLSELLEEYKADKIGPAEYQEQRAKILREP